MGSHKRVRLYKKVIIPPHNKSVYSAILDNNDYGYWKLPYELLFFFRNKIGEEIWTKWKSYEEEIELKGEYCKEFQKLLDKAVELHEKVIGDRWAEFDENNKEHRKVYDEIAEMFHFKDEVKTDYDGYNISHLYDEYEFFTELLYYIEKDEDYYITLIFD